MTINNVLDFFCPYYISLSFQYCRRRPNFEGYPFCHNRQKIPHSSIKKYTAILYLCNLKQIDQFHSCDKSICFNSIFRIIWNSPFPIICLFYLLFKVNGHPEANLSKRSGIFGSTDSLSNSSPDANQASEQGKVRMFASTDSHSKSSPVVTKAAEEGKV